jgi:Transposase DDE domain
MGPATPHDLAPRDRRPSTHPRDGGSVDADLLVTAQARPQIEVLGPPLGSSSRQRRAGQGHDLSAFGSNGEAHQARGPQGQTGVKWTPGREASGAPVVRIRFDTAPCRACPVRQACTWAKGAPRPLPVRPQAQHEAMQAARQRQATPEFHAQYAQRAGIEGTPAPGIRRGGLRRTRYRGLAKAHLQHLITAVALNVGRVGEWWLGTPQAKTRGSPFPALRKVAASRDRSDEFATSIKISGVCAILDERGWWPHRLGISSRDTLLTTCKPADHRGSNKTSEDVVARGLAGKPITFFLHREWHRPNFRYAGG